MSWVKLDDQFADHPKVLSAGPVAAWLWVCGLAYCARYLTDGLIPTSALKKLADVEDPQSLAAKLVEVGLWDEAEGGWMVHDYHEWQPTGEEVREKRKKSLERMAKWRDRKKPTTEPCNASRDALVTRSERSSGYALPVPVPVPVPLVDQYTDLVQTDLVPVADAPSPEHVEVGQKKQATDLDSSELTQCELVALGAVVADPTLAPIVKAPNRLARDLCAAGPGLDIRREVNAAGAWLRANPTKAKKNGNRFLLGWITRSQESGRSYAGGSEPKRQGIVTTHSREMSSQTAMDIMQGLRDLKGPKIV